MTPSKFPGYIFELLAMHEMFRRLKFPADDLFVVIGRSEVGEGMLYIQFHCKLVQPPRDEFFVIDVTRLKGNAIEAKAAWLAALDWWCNSTTTDYERDMVMDASEVYGRAANLVATLMTRGFLPRQLP